MNDFVDLLRTSTIVQGILTVMFTGAWLYMVQQGRTPPDSMTNFLAIVIGFYFGAKVQALVNKQPPPDNPDRRS